MKKQFSWWLPHLEVRNTNKGKGFFTTEGIKAGDLVVICGGYVMTLEEEKILPESMRDIAHQIHEFFVLGVKELDEVQEIDSINHSCQPNCGFEGQIFLVAMRNIEPGEEISFDYAMVLRGTEQNGLMYTFECLCGADACRKNVTSDDWQKKELQEKYKGYFQPHIQKVIDSAM